MYAMFCLGVPCMLCEAHGLARIPTDRFELSHDQLESCLVACSSCKSCLRTETLLSIDSQAVPARDAVLSERCFLYLHT